MSTLHNLKIQYDWVRVFKYWSSLVVPVGWCPWFKFCSRFLQVCADELLQFSRWHSLVWKFIWKIAKSRQNNICKEKKKKKNYQKLPHHGFVKTKIIYWPWLTRCCLQLHVNKVFIIIKQFSFLYLLQDGPSTIYFTRMNLKSYELLDM